MKSLTAIFIRLSSSPSFLARAAAIAVFMKLCFPDKNIFVLTIFFPLNAFTFINVTCSNSFFSVISFKYGLVSSKTNNDPLFKKFNIFKLLFL